MANRIGCEAGKTKIIDPNAFDGQDSSNNIPVPLEDLNISVALTTFKKGRTILSASENNNVLESSRDLIVNFLDGSEINGSRVLTTNYTDFTTVFDDNSSIASSSGEALGITSIDIDFNSQIAPMIVINFVDVKGSAIFQNEMNLKQGRNKYSTFFQLPYPLFELTIKGYYGKPVKYCLHLTKFNTKFNSKTGNFEITANFIGYTYAMLSDMLIGYLKAIPYTKIGKGIYDKLNEERAKLELGEMLTLNDLMIKISHINDEIEKTTAKDDDSFKIRIIDEQRDILEIIENITLAFGKELDSRPTEEKEKLNKFEYIVKTKQDVKNSNNIVNNYKEKVLENVKKFNENSEDIVFDETIFNLPYSFINQTKKILKVDEGESKFKFSRANKILTYLETNKNTLILNDDSAFDYWDLTDIYNKIDDNKIVMDRKYKEAKTNLAIKIKDRIKKTIGFDSTVRNIIEVLTTAVEVFMETIYTVSLSAEQDADGLRAKQLLLKFKADENSDYKQEIAKNKNKIFPWPDYREKEGVEGYVEKYLGEKGVLDIPTDVDELEFIDDLLKAFLEAQKDVEKAQDVLDNVETSWFPINPVDTKLFGITESPYKRIGKSGLSNYDEIAKLMLLRGMTFLTYSNTFLSDSEIENMAEIEATTMLSDIADDKLKQGLSLVDVNYLTNLTANIDINNGSDLPINRSIVTLQNDNYVYSMFTYIDESAPAIMPINEGFEGKWLTNIEPNVFEDSENDETIFLTNYNNKKPLKKTNDGGIYIKIFSKEEFDSNKPSEIKNKPNTVDLTPQKMVLSKLKETSIKGDITQYGFNCFGGSYGIQEFVNMNFGKYEGLALRNVFFEEQSKIGFTRRLLPNSNTDYDFRTSRGSGSSLIRNTDTTFFHNENLRTWNPVNNKLDTAFINIGGNWSNIYAGEPKSITYPFVELTYGVSSNTDIYKYNFSLFGSRWYYGQSLSNYPLYSKGLLFLSTLPWNGMPFEKNEIRHLFDTRAGFIHVPKLWAAYVGGLLWRMDTSAPEMESGNIVGGGSGIKDPIIWKKSANDILIPHTGDNSDFIAPNRNKDINSLSILSDITSNVYFYSDLPTLLTTIPQQVKNEFKTIFFEFINSDFSILDEKSRLINGNINEFDSKLEIIYNAIDNEFEERGTNASYINTDYITDNFINIENYQWIIPLFDDNHLSRQIALMYNGVGSDSTKPVGIIIDLLIEDVVIANTNYNIWDIVVNTDTDTYDMDVVKISKIKFDKYFNKLLNTISNKINSTSSLTEKRQLEQEIFGTTDENIIKLQLYRTCKNTFDKWLGGVNNIDNIIFQCGSSSRNSLDNKIANKYRAGDKSRLIDSFRFVDRSFTDIGDKLYINPEPLNEYLMNSPNSSFYDVVGDLLTSNNFNFIALPTYINYNDPKELNSIFEPYPKYAEAIKDGVCGPSFVSVYVGQTSKHLDFAESDYTNDGIDFQCDKISKIPEDFANTANDFENDVAVFGVNFGQQNQNIFKDITLDQNEFSETAESLQVTDNIASKGAENNRSLAGQNIFNVYSVRSYKAEVEMLGNAMIQPMMHFQLNNIPMFHGAYLITRVKHSIQPNTMSTNFTGVRIRYPKTKLMEGIDFFMNIIDSIDLTTATAGGSSGSGRSSSNPPIVMTIRNNNGLNGNIESGGNGNIKLKKVTNVVGVTSLVSGRKDGGDSMLAEAADALVEMLKAFVVYAKNEEYPKDGKGNYLSINSLFRTIARQKELYADSSKKGSVAFPGSSNHGWGIAVDLAMIVQKSTPKGLKKGQYFPINTSYAKEGFNLEYNPSLKWFLDNSYKYGFIIPLTLRDGVNIDEFWHFEYHGTAAKCLLSINPNIYGYKVNVTADYKPIVINPKGHNTNKPVTYSQTDCKNTTVSGRDGNIAGSQIPTKDIYDNLKKYLKLSDESIAGIMGNLYQESRFIPTALNPTGGDYGLAQWIDIKKNGKILSDRKTDLLNFITKNNLDKTSHIDQIKYIEHDLNRFKFTKKYLEKKLTAEEAARIFFLTYERTIFGIVGWSESQLTQYESDASLFKRKAYATQIMNMISNKSFKLVKDV